MPGGVSPRICVLMFVVCPFPRDELLGGWWRAKVAFPHCSTPPPLASTPCEGLSERDGGLAYVQIVAGLCVGCEECVYVCSRLGASAARSAMDKAHKAGLMYLLLVS